MSTQRVLSTISARAPTRRLGVTVFASLASMVIAACGIETPENAPRTLAVQPRVIVDGLVELGAVAGSRVVIDEVLFHAPTVTVEESHGAVDSLLARGESPLLFRYDATSSDGFGDVLGGEREWTVSDTHGELVVGFAPLGVQLSAMIELEDETGVKLGDLRGHTAMVHGFLLVDAPNATELGCDGPACSTSSFVADDNDGDPDGNPSEGDPTKPNNRSDGDPDGNPSRPTGTKAGDAAESAKRSAADGDPDGNPADGDPDGNPSQDPDDTTREGQAMTERVDQGPIRAVDRRVASVKVPFFLVLNRSFSLHVPVAELFEKELSDDEVRPLELHVRLDELLSEPMLELLNEEATDTAAGAIIVEVPSVDAGLDVDNQGVVRRVRADVSTGGIRVVGGR